MANKRDLKKFVRNTCGALALDMVTVSDLFPQIDSKDVEKVVYDCAVLQTSTLSKAGISFDRSASDFESKSAYSAARRSYFRKAYRALKEQFAADVDKLVKVMNQALPDDVRQILRKAAADA